MGVKRVYLKGLGVVGVVEVGVVRGGGGGIRVY